MFYIKTKHTFEVNTLVFIRTLAFHPECTPPHRCDYDTLVVNALNASEHISDREIAAIETVKEIVIRLDGAVLSAEIQGDTDYAQFQIVLNDSPGQRVGDIVG